MTRSVKVWWPYQATAEEVVQVEIPDGVDPEDWLADNEDRLVEEAAQGEIHPNAFDLGYAGAKFEKDKT
jgi:hypothetical protein